MRLFSSIAALMLVALAGCSDQGRDDNPGGGVSEDLLSTESNFSDDVTVFQDRLVYLLGRCRAQRPQGLQQVEFGGGGFGWGGCLRHGP